MSKLIIANWKSHKTFAEAQSWLDEFGKQEVSQKVVIAAPFPFLSLVSEKIKVMPHVSLGVQTISSFPAGSYTGAVSARNLEGLGVTHALVGHSERRRYFHETNQDVAKQVDQCLQNGITPIVCVDTDYLAQQASAIAGDQLRRCIVAYEPVEAIGSGNNVPGPEVVEAANRIKVVFGNVPVLYGGSVNARDVQEYLPIVDGFIVGTASLDVHEFSELLQAIAAQK